jgi:hypothetical protein
MGTRLQVIDWPNNGGGIPTGVSVAGDARMNLANAPRELFISQNGYPTNEVMLGFPLSWGADNPANNSFLGHWDFLENAVELGTRIPAPFRGTIYRLSVRALDANWSAAGRIFTIRKNAVSAGIASNATATNTNLVGNTATATTFVRGDALSIQLTGGALTNRIWATVFLVPTG